MVPPDDRIVPRDESSPHQPITRIGRRAKENRHAEVHRFAAGDKIYCVHSAESAEVVREHARRGGFPVDAVTPVGTTFGPENG